MEKQKQRACGFAGFRFYSRHIAKMICFARLNLSSVNKESIGFSRRLRAGKNGQKRSLASVARWHPNGRMTSRLTKFAKPDAGACSVAHGYQAGRAFGMAARFGRLRLRGQAPKVVCVDGLNNGVRDIVAREP